MEGHLVSILNNNKNLLKFILFLSPLVDNDFSKLYCSTPVILAGARDGRSSPDISELAPSSIAREPVPRV